MSAHWNCCRMYIANINASVRIAGVPLVNYFLLTSPHIYAVSDAIYCSRTEKSRIFMGVFYNLLQHELRERWWWIPVPLMGIRHLIHVHDVRVCVCVVWTGMSLAIIMPFMGRFSVVVGCFVWLHIERIILLSAAAVAAAVASTIRIYSNARWTIVFDCAFAAWEKQFSLVRVRPQRTLVFVASTSARNTIHLGDMRMCVRMPATTYWCDMGTRILGQKVTTQSIQYHTVCHTIIIFYVGNENVRIIRVYRTIGP